MEGERGGQQSNAICDRPGRQPLRAALDEKPIDLQAMFVGERPERFDDLGSLHSKYDITTIVEKSRGTPGCPRLTKHGAQARGRALLPLSLMAVVWFGLIDWCLIRSSGMPISGKIITLLMFQLVIGSLILLLINGVFPVVVEVMNDVGKFRLKFAMFGVPVILFLASPALISYTLYQSRYGYIDRIVVNAHVAHDLGCCWIPFEHS